MQGAIIVVTVFAGSILILAVIGSTILMGLRILKGGVRPKDRKSATDEARVIQEMYHGLARMEERVESLETIILDRERERKERRK